VRQTVALILAAGQASRMRPYSREMPKCLFELAPGLSILDYTLRVLREEGVDRVVVVTRPSLKQAFVERYGSSVEVVTTDAEEGFGNLYSLKAGMDAVDGEEFLLLMSDHIFEPKILRRLIRGGGGKAFTLCLDRNPPWDKIEEGLKVVVRNGVIEQVGKQAPPYYGVDTGLFYCSKGARRVVDETIAELGPKATIADALRRAIGEREVGYVDVTGLMWLDVDTPEDLESARRMLPNLLRRSLVKPEDGPVSRYLNRPISTRISVWLYLKGWYVSPNLVSLISFAVGLAGSISIVLGLNLLAAALIQAASVLDGVDGEIARLFQRASRFGGIFDAMLDRYADLSVVAAIGFTQWPLTPLQVLLLTIAAGNVFIYSYVTHMAEKQVVRRIRAYSPAGRDVRLLAAAIAVALQRPWAFIAYLASVPLAMSSAVAALSARAAPRRREAKVPKRLPIPHLELKGERLTEIEENITQLLSASLKLFIALVILKTAGSLISGIGAVELGPISVKPEHAVGFLQLMATVYFGYKILMSSIFFTDLMSEWLVRRIGVVTRAAVRRGLADIIYLGFIALLMKTIPPLLEEMPRAGATAAKLSTLALLALFILVTYDLAKLFYRSFKGIYNRAVSRIAEKLKQLSEERHRASGPAG